MSVTTLIRGFSFAEVVGGALAVLFRNFLMFMFLALVFSAPVTFYPQYMPPPTTEGGVYAYLAGVFLLQLVSMTLTMAALVYGTVQTLRGRPAPAGATISHAFAVLFPAIGVSLVLFIAFLLAGLAGSIPMFIFGSVWLVVIPAVVVLILVVRWWVAVPAIVVERGGVFDSIGRSTELTRGYRWPIFGIILLYGVVQWIVTFVLAKAFGADDPYQPVTLTFTLVDWAVYGFFTALSACLTGVAYFALRVQQEGVDVDQVASVFD